MSFYGSDFIYDGISSSDFGLKISNFGEDSSTTPGASVELFTESIYRRQKSYLFGVQQTPVLTIPITITVSYELSAVDASIVSRWLFGKLNYKKLQIIQPDMQYVYFNCIFTNPEVIRVGNIIRGFNTQIVCDSPFAWEYPKPVTYLYSLENYTVSDTITYNNYSDNADYTYPAIEIVTNRFGGDFTITNLTDSNRAFTFSGLNANETLMVDNELQIIQSSETNENRIQNFNYNWFRLLPNINKITLSGNIYYLRIINHFARKIA